MQLPERPLRSALGMVCRYHLGSVAFGSCIIAIVKFIRACVEYMREHAARASRCGRARAPCACMNECCVIDTCDT